MYPYEQTLHLKYLNRDYLKAQVYVVGAHGGPIVRGIQRNRISSFSGSSKGRSVKSGSPLGSLVFKGAVLFWGPN